MVTYLEFKPNKLKLYYKISKMYTLDDYVANNIVLLRGKSSLTDFGLYLENNTTEFYQLFQEHYSSFFNAIVAPTLK